MSETSTKPYLLRALHEWCVENNYTPHIVVTVDEHTVVPLQHVQDGQITLNLAYSATNQLVLGNDYIEFQARFNGVTEDLFVPVPAVAALYARETGAGMGFEVSESQPYPGTTDSKESASPAAPTPTAPTAAPDGKDSKPSHLSIVKS